MIVSGQPRTGLYRDGKRFEARLPLRDSAGNIVGALSVGFRYEDGADQKALFSRAERSRDELQRRIPSVERLVELDP